MQTSKDLFHRSKTDVKAALGITKSDIFFKMIAYSRAMFSQQNPTYEQATGANNFINILFNLPEEDTEPEQWIDSGLQHDLSIPEKTDKQQPKTK